MRPARCNLRAAACAAACAKQAVLRPAAKYAASRSTQIAARRPHRNSIAILVEIQRKLKYVQLGAGRGLRQSMNRPLASVLFVLYREALVV